MINDEMFGRDRDVPTTEDYISRQDALKRIEAIEPISPSDDYQKGIAVGFGMAKISIREQQSVSVQPSIGHWIWKKRRRVHNYTVERTVKSIYGVESKEPIIIHDEWTEEVNYCSACGKRGDDTFFNYCPNCGAKMEMK